MSEGMTKGAQKAYDAMTGDWQRPGNKTFTSGGAKQAVLQRPDLCEMRMIKMGKEQWERPRYRRKETPA